MAANDLDNLDNLNVTYVDYDSDAESSQAPNEIHDAEAGKKNALVAEIGRKVRTGAEIGANCTIIWGIVCGIIAGAAPEVTNVYWAYFCVPALLWIWVYTPTKLAYQSSKQHSMAMEAPTVTMLFTLSLVTCATFQYVKCLELISQQQDIVTVVQQCWLFIVMAVPVGGATFVRLSAYLIIACMYIFDFCKTKNTTA